MVLVSCGPNILIDPEKVIGVVFLLYSCQAFIIIAVSGLHSLLAFFHHEIHVSATGRVSM